jgi:hypothetical protein
MFEILLNTESLRQEVRANVLLAKATLKYYSAIVDTELSLVDKRSIVVQPIACLVALASR